MHIASQTVMKITLCNTRKKITKSQHDKRIYIILYELHVSMQTVKIQTTTNDINRVLYFLRLKLTFINFLVLETNAGSRHYNALNSPLA